MKRIYTSIDIGSDTIKVVVCELFKNKLNLLAATTSKSFGIKKGLITDVELAKKSIKNAIEEVEKMLGIQIEKVIANVPSYFADFSMVTGKKNITNDDMIVNSKDVVDVIDNSCESFSSANADILTILPIDFKVDDKIVSDPKGMPGKTLQVRGILVSLPSKNIYSVIGLLESIGIKVADVSLNGISDYHAFKTKELDSLAGLIINIGSETTNISLFNKGILVKNSVVSSGGKDITNDIAYIYKLDYESATKVKEKFALAHKRYASTVENYEITNKLNQNVSINQAELSEIVNSRLEECLNLIKTDINRLANRKIDYIILCGGTSNVPYLSEVAEDILKQKVTIGEIKTIGIRNNKYSTCIGNIIYFIQKLKLKGLGYTMFDEDDANILSSPRKNNINETNILKALISFFDE